MRVKLFIPYSRIFHHTLSRHTGGILFYLICFRLLGYKSFQVSVIDMVYSISSKVCSRTAGFNWHSQIVITLQPDFFSASLLRSSLLRLASILLRQNSVLVRGMVPSTSCPCQKHPWMKITMPYLCNTMSGVPGNPFTFLR